MLATLATRLLLGEKLADFGPLRQRGHGVASRHLRLPRGGPVHYGTAAAARGAAPLSTRSWALGTSSLNVDDTTYTLIHVDFPVAFVSAWLDARTAALLADQVAS